jgi:hypothetical protein
MIFIKELLVINPIFYSFFVLNKICLILILLILTFSGDHVALTLKGKGYFFVSYLLTLLALANF